MQIARTGTHLSILLVAALIVSTAARAGTAKIAFVHHANQHLAGNGLLAGAHDTRPGYWATLDSHNYNGVPVDLHVSGTLAQSYAWNQDGGGLLHSIGASSRVEVVGGSYSEHILPYTDEDINFFSLGYFDEIMENVVNPVGSVGGWATNRPKTVWIPERVWKMNLQHDLAATYGYEAFGQWKPPVILLDSIVHDWYCSVGGDHDYHNIHQMWNEYGEEVLVAFICPVANENWLNPSSVQNIGGHMNGHLRWLRDHSDQQKICIYGDDWEKVAGVADWWDNTAEYDSNISWVSSQGWVDKIHVSEAAQWWGVDQSPVNITIPYAAYSYLHSWTGGNYDFWYDDSVIQWGKESVVATAAVDCGGAADRNGNGVSGDFEDLWKTAVENLRLVSDIPMPDPVVDMLGGHPYPSQTAGIVTALCENSCVVPDYDNDYGNPLARAGWVTLTSLLYELGWHDGGGPFMSGWQKNLINHTRYANAFARGAYWHDYRPSTARAVALDIDGDGIDEMLLENDRIAVYFDRRGGRALFMFDSEGRVIAGNVLSNWGGEGDWDDGGHRGLFHDDMGWNSWFDYSIDVAGGPMARVTLNEVYDNQGSPSTDVVKTLTLRSGSSAIQVDISSDYQNWTRFGVTPDLLSNLSSGYDLLPIQGASDFGLVYGGYRCNSSGAAAAILLHGDDDLTLEMESRASSVAEQMRAGGRSGEYTLWAYGGSGTPSIPGFPLDGRLDDVAIWEVDDGEGHFLRVSFDSETGDLYVATNGAGGAETADHFIFVSDAPGAATAAPWAKSGTVPDWDLYLADENDSGYEAWFDANAGIYAQANSRAGVVLEGAFDLDGEMGSIPPVVYVAAAGFGNDDGGELLWQVPAGDGDGNIDVGELGEYAYLAVRLIPDAASFPRGGQLGYDAVLVNEHMTGTVVDLAVQARLPNGSAYPAQPRVIWGGQELDPGESALSFSHNIPGFAPLGSYRFDATLAPSGGDPVAEDSFAFDVTP